MAIAQIAFAGDANPLGLVLSHGVPAHYVPGATVELVITISNPDDERVTAMGMTDAVPEGWTFAGARGISANPPEVVPPVGIDGRIEFAWISQQTFPYSFAYTLHVPEDFDGDAVISGQLEYRGSGPRLVSDPDIVTIAGPVETCDLGSQGFFSWLVCLIRHFLQQLFGIEA